MQQDCYNNAASATTGAKTIEDIVVDRAQCAELDMLHVLIIFLYVASSDIKKLNICIVNMGKYTNVLVLSSRGHCGRCSTKCKTGYVAGIHNFSYLSLYVIYKLNICIVLKGKYRKCNSVKTSKP